MSQIIAQADSLSMLFLPQLPPLKKLFFISIVYMINCPTDRCAVDTMQSICLKEAGVSSPLAQETTLVGYTFGGYLRSKVVFNLTVYFTVVCVFSFY